MQRVIAPCATACWLRPRRSASRAPRPRWTPSASTSARSASRQDRRGDQQGAGGRLLQAGRRLAEAAVPGLADLQKAGEGAFETLARVAREYQVVDVSLQSIGKTFGATGLASLAARDDLVQLFGTLDDFASATQAFADDFLTEAERMAPIQKAVQDELARLGVTGVNTKEQFKQLVLAQDLTTEAGREMYARCSRWARPSPRWPTTSPTGSKEINDARDALSAAYERESDALQGTIDRFREFSASLSEFRESLYTGPAPACRPKRSTKPRSPSSTTSRPPRRARRREGAGRPAEGQPGLSRRLPAVLRQQRPLLRRPGQGPRRRRGRRGHGHPHGRQRDPAARRS
jgi:hypothetical protein